MKIPSIPLLVSITSGLLFCPVGSANTIPVQLAEPAVLEAQEVFPDDKTLRYSFIRGYCEAFLDSLRHGADIENYHRSFSCPGWSQGYNAGQLALKDKDINKSITPSSFGYAIEELRGTYNSGWEKSEFVASGTKEKFHLNSGYIESLPKGEFLIRAWVSPKTELGFGHFNQWRREIIVMEILDNK